MLQTLIAIPDKIWGLPVFGFGLLAAIWAVASIAALVWLVRRYGFGVETRDVLPMIVICGGLILFVAPLMEDARQRLPIRSYGVMMLLGVISGVMLAVRRAPAARLDPEIVFSLAFWAFGVGIVGARAFHVIQYWRENYSNKAHPTWASTLAEIISVHRGGLVVYGSVIAVTLVLPVFAWRHRLPWLAVADLIAPSFMIGLALGRIGCLLNGCCYGGPTEYSWAITFPAETERGVPSIPYESQHLLGMFHGVQIASSGDRVVIDKLLLAAPREAGLKVGDQITAINDRPLDSPEVVRHYASKGIVDSDGPINRLAIAKALLGESGPAVSMDTADGRHVAWSVGAFPARSLRIHPTQIYSAIDALLICLLLLAYYPFRRHDGEVAALLLTIYPVTRFLIESLRIDEAKQFGPSQWTIGQVVSLSALAFAAGLWIYLLRKPPGHLWAEQTELPAR